MIKFKIHNIVATSSVDFQINLSKFAELNGFTIDEAYPTGVHCRNNKIEGLITVFRTGKIISVGANSLKKVKSNLSFIHNLLRKQRKEIEIIKKED